MSKKTVTPEELRLCSEIAHRLTYNIQSYEQRLDRRDELNAELLLCIIENYPAFERFRKQGLGIINAWLLQRAYRLQVAKKKQDFPHLFDFNASDIRKEIVALPSCHPFLLEIYAKYPKAQELQWYFETDEQPHWPSRSRPYSYYEKTIRNICVSWLEYKATS